MREVDNFKFTVNRGKVESVRMRISGGATGDHCVDYDGKEWFCDCKGFSVRKSCRHCIMGKTVRFHAWNALDDIKKMEED